METAKLILEYLKVLLSVQMVAGIVLLSFFLIFEDAITNLIGRIKNIAFGKANVSTPQLEKSNSPAGDMGDKDKPPVDSDEEVSVPNGLQLSPEQLKRIREWIRAERANARTWEYRYLGFYLAHSTQLILDDLAARRDRVTVSLLDNWLQPFIESAAERKAIINALQNHHLIEIDGDLINVTEKGREYIAWRGPATRAAA